jgi:hypothetical protein
VAVPLVAVLTLMARLLGQLVPHPPADPALVTTRRLLPLQAATAGLAGVTVVTWAALLVAAVERVTHDLALADVWGPGGLPLLAAGVYAVVPALLPSSRTTRVGALALAVLPWTLLVTAPAWDETPTTLALVMAVTTLVLAGTLFLGPLPWVRAAGAGLVVTVPVLLAHSVELAAAGVETFVRAAGQAWDGTPGGRLDPDVAGMPAPWVLPAALLVLVLTGFAAWRAWTGQRPTREHVERVGEMAVIAAVHGGLLVHHVPVVVLLLVMLATVFRVGADSLRGHRRMPFEAAGVTVVVLGALALALSAYDEWLSLLACVVLGGLAVLYHRRDGATGHAGGFALSVLGAGAVWSGTALVDLAGEWSALVVLLALGAWVVRTTTCPSRAETGSSGSSSGSWSPQRPARCWPPTTSPPSTTHRRGPRSTSP